MACIDIGTEPYTWTIGVSDLSNEGSGLDLATMGCRWQLRVTKGDDLTYKIQVTIHRLSGSNDITFIVFVRIRLQNEIGKICDIFRTQRHLCHPYLESKEFFKYQLGKQHHSSWDIRFRFLSELDDIAPCSSPYWNTVDTPALPSSSPDEETIQSEGAKSTEEKNPSEGTRSSTIEDEVENSIEKAKNGDECATDKEKKYGQDRIVSNDGNIQVEGANSLPKRENEYQESDEAKSRNEDACALENEARNQYEDVHKEFNEAKSQKEETCTSDSEARNRFENVHEERDEAKSQNEETCTSDNEAKNKYGDVHDERDEAKSQNEETCTSDNDAKNQYEDVQKERDEAKSQNEETCTSDNDAKNQYEDVHEERDEVKVGNEPNDLATPIHSARSECGQDTFPISLALILRVFFYLFASFIVASLVFMTIFLFIIVEPSLLELAFALLTCLLSLLGLRLAYRPCFCSSEMKKTSVRSRSTQTGDEEISC